MRPTDPDPHDVPGFDRALGIDDPVPDSAYGDRGYDPECEVSDSGQPPIDDFHEALLEVEQELRELEKQLPRPLTLTDSIKELDATADAYVRFKSDHDGNPERK